MIKTEGYPLKETDFQKSLEREKKKGIKRTINLVENRKGKLKQQRKGMVNIKQK